jgi:hypothetical protein
VEGSLNATGSRGEGKQRGKRLPLAVGQLSLFLLLGYDPRDSSGSGAVSDSRGSPPATASRTEGCVLSWQLAGGAFFEQEILRRQLCNRTCEEATEAAATRGKFRRVQQ